MDPSVTELEGLRMYVKTQGCVTKSFTTAHVSYFSDINAYILLFHKLNKLSVKKKETKYELKKAGEVTFSILA